MKQLWEILIPTISNEGKPFRTRFHRVWDGHVREIADEKLFAERMIPVRIMCTQNEIETIADLTAKYYSQLAIMYYRISDLLLVS